MSARHGLEAGSDGFERLGELDRDVVLTVMLVDAPDPATGRGRRHVVSVEESDHTNADTGAVENTVRDVQLHSPEADVPYDRSDRQRAANT